MMLIHERRNVTETIKWTDCTTKALIAAYTERQIQFQEPFAKPGKLWAAVSEQLQRLGHQVHDVMNNCIIYEFIFHVFRISAYEQLY